MVRGASFRLPSREAGAGPRPSRSWVVGPGCCAALLWCSSSAAPRSFAAARDRAGRARALIRTVVVGVLDGAGAAPAELVIPWRCARLALHRLAARRVVGLSLGRARAAGRASAARCAGARADFHRRAAGERDERRRAGGAAGAAELRRGSARGRRRSRYRAHAGRHARTQARARGFHGARHARRVHGRRVAFCPLREDRRGCLHALHRDGPRRRARGARRRRGVRSFAPGAGARPRRAGADGALARSEFAAAAALFHRETHADPTAWKGPYNLACAYARAGAPATEAALREAVRRDGAAVRRRAVDDADLASVRDRPWFAALVGGS